LKCENCLGTGFNCGIPGETCHVCKGTGTKTFPFYKKALALFTRTQEAQIQKGLAKYPEPFNPHNWTPEELLNHALEETVDLTHYLVGLKELLDVKDEQIQSLHKHWSLAMDSLMEKNKEIERLKHEVDQLKQLTRNAWIKPLPKKSPFEEQYDMNFNPHFDQDDQH
jgi:hypothetical protein